MLMMLRTGAVVSAALDGVAEVDHYFLQACTIVLDATFTSETPG